MKKVLEEKLMNEIRKIERELTVDLPKEIHAAASLGDLSENAEYQAALERQSYLQNRLGSLKKQAATIALISEQTIPKDKVALGSTVYLRNLDTDEEKVFHIVLGDIAEPERGEISPSSPIGRALLNKELGEEIEVRTPSGIVEYEITNLKTVFDKIDK
ncbi:MAG: GreA/GreB family elongation factor [Acidobacteria bacterium]|nr:GreA/GreB family elongation factor [Acidobacteriota bacterium]